MCIPGGRDQGLGVMFRMLRCALTRPPGLYSMFKTYQRQHPPPDFEETEVYGVKVVNATQNLSGTKGGWVHILPRIASSGGLVNWCLHIIKCA